MRALALAVAWGTVSLAQVAAEVAEVEEAAGLELSAAEITLILVVQSHFPVASASLHFGLVEGMEPSMTS